jgi:hypothetical protein
MRGDRQERQIGLHSLNKSVEDTTWRRNRIRWRACIVAHRFAVKEPRSTPKVAAQDKQFRDALFVHVVVRTQHLAERGHDARVVEMQVGEENEGGFVMGRLFGGDEVGLQSDTARSSVRGLHERRQRTRELFVHLFGCRNDTDTEKVVVPVDLPAGSGALSASLYRMPVNAVLVHTWLHRVAHWAGAQSLPL